MNIRFRLSLLLLLSAIFSFLSCSRGDRPVKTETVSIAAPSLEQNALLYVANHEKLFVNNGLNVVMKDYDSGVTAMNAMLKGEADVAGAAEFPVVRTLFQKEDVRIIACYDKFENDYIVGRKD